MKSSTTTVVLEPAAQGFADATADPPYLFDLGPVEGRRTVDGLQSGEVEKPDVEMTDTTNLDIEGAALEREPARPDCTLEPASARA